jgi:hypothetical protein
MKYIHNNDNLINIQGASGGPCRGLDFILADMCSTSCVSSPRLFMKIRLSILPKFQVYCVVIVTMVQRADMGRSLKKGSQLKGKAEKHEAFRINPAPANER